MRILGTYQYAKQRDEKSGYTYFLFQPEDRNFPCTYGKYIGVKGKIQECPKGTPLEIDCDIEHDKNGRTQYVLKEYTFSCYSANAIVELLQGLCLKDFSDSKKQKILAADLNLFDAEKKEENLVKLKKTGFAEEEAIQIIEKTTSLIRVKNIADMLMRYGVAFSVIQNIYRKFRENDGIGQIQKHPYSLLKFGVPFHICETIAIDLGFGQYDKARLQALVHAAYTGCVSSGHTKVTLKMLADYIAFLEKSVNHGWNTDILYCINGLDDYVVKNEDDAWFIYERHMYQMETSIAQNIQRLMHNQTSAVNLENVIQATEQTMNIRYAPQQKDAFQLLRSSGVKILTGGPGTGKTTTVGGLICAERLMNPQAEILLCAPTATAAKRASEASGMRGTTIHRMLDIRPVGERLVQFRDENNRLSADLIIVDEVSMVDTEVFFMLMRAVKNSAIVLLVGDENQLQSVGPGNILHDLIASNCVETCRLTVVYRQLLDSLIVSNSVQICRGKTDLQSGNDYELISCDTETQMRNVLYDLMDEYYDISDPSKTKVFSPVRKKAYELSTWKINLYMHKKYHHEEDDEYVYNAQWFSRGDPVIFTRNNYETGYCNGDMGVVTGILVEENGKKGLLVQSYENEFAISGADMADIELAYSVTTHKAQGGECDVAIVLLPLEPKNMLTRSLIYVATTRAKKKCIVLYQKDALEYGIRNNYQAERLTGLKCRLTERTR